MDKKLKFKKGDWCFCEFKLQQVKKTEGNRITEVSDGNFSHGSSDLTDRCFPLEMNIKRYSDTAAYWRKEFSNLNNNALNFPDLNRELIERWAAMCENEINGDDKHIEKLWEDLNKFGRDVCDKVKDLKNDTVGGVPLFRR